MSSRAFAILMLIGATAAWGYSFPGGKAWMSALSTDLPGKNAWFYSGLMISTRFALAAVLLLLWSFRSLRRIRASEVRQGIGLGVFAGLGLLLQTDGLQYTTASAVAFLTQFIAVLVPLYCAIRDRRMPPARTLVCVLMMMAGVAVMGQFDWHALRFGRGELETLVATCFFTAQILWLDRPIFRGNDTGRVSLLMFTTCAIVTTPTWLVHTESIRDLAPVLLPRMQVGVVFLSLTVACTLVAFLLMNRWQPHVDPTTAGFVYCAEPLFATGLALFLPDLLGRFLGVQYANEHFTLHLLVGGGLITLANVVIAVAPPPPVEKSSKA